MTHSGAFGFTCIHLGSLGFTWNQLVSLAMPWSRLDSLESTWSSLGLIWNHIGFPWTGSVLRRFTWTHLDCLGLTRLHLNFLDSFGFTWLTWIHLESLDLIRFGWIRLDPFSSPLLSSLVQGKREHGLMEKKRGKVPAHGFHSVLTSQRYVAHARHDPKQFLCWGS